MKKSEGTFLFIFLFSLVILTLSCDGGSSNSEDSPSMDDQYRDCSSDYDYIINNTYTEPEDAINACNNFINKYGSECVHLEDVQKILEQFQNMRHDLSRYSDDFSYFIREVGSTEEYSNSSYPVVAESWENCFKNERTKRLNAILDKLTFEDFQDYMEEDAMERVKTDYSSGGPFGLVPTGNVETIEHSELTSIESSAAKECTAIFRVRMEGAMGLGLRSGTVKIKIIGQLGVTHDGELEYHPKDYSVIETTGAC